MTGLLLFLALAVAGLALQIAGQTALGIASMALAVSVYIGTMVALRVRAVAHPKEVARQMDDVEYRLTWVADDGSTYSLTRLPEQYLELFRSALEAAGIPARLETRVNDGFVPVSPSS